MKSGSKSKIAQRAMIFIASQKPAAPISLADIATRVGKSLSYLEQIFGRLNKAGLVDSARGPLGGYKVSSLAVSYSDIVIAIEGEVPVPDKDCSPEDAAWFFLSEKTHAFWKTQTLADLIL